MDGVIKRDLLSCSDCPRLVAYRQALEKKYPSYRNKPVGSWGDARCRTLIVGLAPGLHGAHRTGKAFVGDASGSFLFACLHGSGFASHTKPEEARLINARITNAVKCLPPNNLPTTEERNTCQPYLAAEIAQFCPTNARQRRAILCLGSYAFTATCRALGLSGVKYAHGLKHPIRENLSLYTSHHPSRLNVNTGRITTEMLLAVLNNIQADLKQ